MAVANCFGLHAANMFIRPSSRLSGSMESCLALRREILAVSFAGHNEFVEALELPAVFHKIAGEPVEQLGMTGALAELPKSPGVSTMPRPK